MKCYTVLLKIAVFKWIFTVSLSCNRVCNISSAGWTRRTCKILFDKACGVF